MVYFMIEGGIAMGKINKIILIQRIGELDNEKRMY